MGIKRGDRFLYGGKVWSYAASLTAETVQLYDEHSRTYTDAPVGELEPISATPAIIESKGDTLFVNPAEWDVAEFRFMHIKEYFESECSAESFERLHKILDLSIPRTYTLLRLYDAEMGPSAFLREKRGRKTGTKFLSPQVEAIIEAGINIAWNGPGARVVGVHKQIQEMCNSAGVSAPSYKTVNQRVKTRAEILLARLKYGAKKAADIYQPRTGTNTSRAPLARCQMDHCVVDCIIVDEQTRKPLCRPWATLIIDIYSRVVLGFYLSIHAPSSYSVAMAISHAVMPKNRWITALGDEDLKYPYYGKIGELSMDNAKEFKAIGFRVAAKKNNIHLKWRIKGKPWWGGHIERLNHTLSMGYIHYLPGTTLSNVKMRGDYDSEREACLTFSEFRLWFARSIQIYHHTQHSMLEGTPNQQWLKGWTRGDGKLEHPALIQNPQEFTIDFLPQDMKVIGRQGVRMWNIFYWSPSLAQYIKPGIKYPVKYNPYSLRAVWINPTGERWIEVPYSDVTRPDMTLEEYKAAKKQTRIDRDARGGASLEEVFIMVRKNRDLIDSAKKSTKTAIKIQENRQQNVLFSQTIGVEENSQSQVDIDDDEYETPAVIFPVET